jgi:transcription antitermination factor NusG
LKYAIVQCYPTIDLVRNGSDLGIRAPMEKHWYRPVGREPEIRHRAALPGYAFVPESQLASLLRSSLAFLYGVRVLAYDSSQNPVAVDEAMVDDMQARLDQAWLQRNRTQTEIVHPIGAKVRCVAGLFKTFEGVVKAHKKDGHRVLFGTVYVTLSGSLLEKA